MITIRIDESKIQEICKKTKIERKLIFTYPHEAQDATKTVYFNRTPKEFLKEYAATLPVTDKTKSLIDSFLTPPEEILDKTAASLPEVAGLLSVSEGRGDLIGVTSGKLVFPITVDEVTHRDDMWGGSRVSISFSFNYGDVSASGFKNIYPEAIKSFTGDPLPLKEILRKAGLIPVGVEQYKIHKELVAKTYRMQTDQCNKLVKVRGPVYVRPAWGAMPVQVEIGSSPKKAIIEGEIELDESMWYNNTESTDEVIPLVRVFLLEHKTYCYVHVDNISEHVYDTAGFSKVVIPNKVRTLFEQVFSAGPECQFGDIFGGRHGGTVILADGPPGTGKTLTAEAIAELSKRPLYVADVGEIGIDLETVEDKLKLVLARASKWNAVLLLDEADIFLVKRDVDNIERNAIVGTFLKFLDGFDGTLFLTTNRVDVIDPAFASRITARVQYQALDSTARLKIWERMVEAAKVKIPAGVLMELATHKFNGRQIRNLVRLAKMYHRDKELQLTDVTMLFDHVLKVDETWSGAPKGEKE